MRHHTLAVGLASLCTQLALAAHAQTRVSDGGCLLEGSSTHVTMRISPAGVAPFWIDVKDSAVSARFDTGAQVGPAVVAGVLAIRAEAQLDALALHTKVALATDDGVLGIPAGHRLRDVEVVGTTLRTTVSIGGAPASGFVVQCAQSVVGVGWRAKSSAPRANKSAQRFSKKGSTEEVQPLAGRLSLRADIDGARGVRTHVLESSAVARFRLRVLARQGDFVRVERTFPDGSWLRGWTVKSALGVPKPRRLSLGRGWCTTGSGSCRLFGQRRVTAELTLGATIHAQPGAGPWANVLEPVQTTAILTDGQPWAMLEHLPSVRSKHIDRCRSAPASRAFVRTDQLRVSPTKR